jgi:hypothetical protein
MTHCKPDSHQYLFIAGTTKAATSSLFAYLAAHPEVCAASIKETRFFLDPDYPLPVSYRFQDGLDHYERFYNHCAQAGVRLEATPDYLYSPGTPQRLRDSGLNIKLIFSLREPVSRLKSWYKFSRQMGAIPQGLGFEDYILEQAGTEEQNKRQYFRALEQGRYSVYLEPYLKVSEPGSVHIVFYEELLSDPLSIVNDICKFSGIDPGFYRDYQFDTFNKTQSVRSPALDRFYRSARFALRRKIHNRPALSGSLRRVHHTILEPLLSLINVQPQETLILSPEISSFLASYYKEEYHNLELLLSRALPWRK